MHGVWRGEIDKGCRRKLFEWPQLMKLTQKKCRIRLPKT
jgi:hypothetical protein